MANETSWTLDAVHELRVMAKEGLTLPVMSLKLKKSVEAVAAKLAELGITPAASA